MIYTLYLISSVLFILSIHGLSNAKSAFNANLLGILGMTIALITTLIFYPTKNTTIIAIILGGSIGVFIARRTKMTALPELVAAFHSLVGISSVLIAFCAFMNESLTKSTSSLIEISIGTIIGAITFSGSVVAFLKLKNYLKNTFSHKFYLNCFLSTLILILMITFSFKPTIFILFFISCLSLVLGITIFVPVGGADMPVIISLLNSYSGFAAVGIGFTLNNHLLIITGSLVGSSGAILSYVMCKAMNRSILNVIFGVQKSVIHKELHNKNIKTSNASECSFMLSQASNVIIVPGYGMAVSHASHIIKEIANKLKDLGVSVRFAIHPVAGRMPGHMNVLLAEADISYDSIFELEDINNDFGSTDVVLVIGANDITNPAAKTDTTSPIYGMPILDVEKSKMVFFIKRSMSSGYAGIDNELFYKENVFMTFGDAKTICQEILKNIETN